MRFFLQIQAFDSKMDRDQKEPFEATRHHTLYQHLHHVQQPEREEAHTGDISDDSTATGKERRTRLYDRFPFTDEFYREEAAAKITNWTIKQGVEDYSDKSFGTFVWNVIEGNMMT